MMTLTISTEKTWLPLLRLELDGPESDSESCEVFAALARALSMKKRAGLIELIMSELGAAEF